MKQNKLLKTLLLFIVLVLALVLSACGEANDNPDENKEKEDTSLIIGEHVFELKEKVDPVDCQTAGYAHYVCKDCGKELHKTLIIQHDCEDKEDYINLQYCNSCKKTVRLTSLDTIKEEFYFDFKEAMTDAFNKTIDDCYAELNKATESMTEDEKKALSDVVDEKFEDMIDAFYVIKDQYTAAEVNFYSCENEETTEAKDMIEKVYNACLEKYRFLYYDSFHSPLQAYLFEGEDLEKIEKEIQNYKNTQITQLSDEIDELEHDLYFADPALSSDEFNAGYKTLLEKRNQLAVLYNYDNYYEYAHYNRYGRAYDLDQVAEFRKFVKTYIPKLVLSYMDEFYEATAKRTAYSAVLAIEDSPMFDNKNSTSLYVDYLKYLSNDTLNAYDQVNNAFKEGRIYISSTDGVEAGYTTSILNDSTNIMFFYNGEYYSCPNTVVHETGHFLFNDYYNYSDYDLFEVQSQTNEMLFTLFLKNNTKTNCDAIMPYRLYAAYATIQSVTAIDEFEYCLYTNYSDLNDCFKDGIDETEYEKLYSAICSKYSITEISHDTWHYYCTQSSVYEVSYGISLIPAVAKYYEGLTDLAKAKDEYIKLLTFTNDFQVPEDSEEEYRILTFTEALEYCGFDNPFDENTFKALK